MKSHCATNEVQSLYIAYFIIKYGIESKHYAKVIDQVELVCSELWYYYFRFGENMRMVGPCNIFINLLSYFSGTWIYFFSQK